MLVKIGDNIYDSNVEPIMLILSDIDKENIKNMHTDKHKFISYPSQMEQKEIKKWIDSKL